MSRKHFWGTALTFCIALALCVPRADAADVLRAVPDSALGVIVINNVGQTDAKIQQLAGQLQLPQLEMLAKLKAQLGIEKGVDNAGCFALAAIPAGQTAAPIAVAYVPVDDYQAFVEQLNAEPPVDGIANMVAGGKPVVVAERGGFAVIADRSDRAVLATVLSLTDTLADHTSSLDDWRGDTQAYAIATPAGVKLAQQRVLTGLAAIKAQVSQQLPQSPQTVMGIEIYENLFKRLDQEITYCAAGLRIEDSGDVHLVSRTHLADGGVAAQLAAHVQPGKTDCLAGLPQMPFVFAGGGVFSPDMIEPMVNASFNMMRLYPGGEKLTDEQLRKIIDDSARYMKGMRSMGMMLGVGKGGEPLYSRMYLVIKVDDAEQYMKDYQVNAREISKIFDEADFPFSYEIESVQIKDRPGVQLAMDTKGILGQQDLPGGEKIKEMMFGGADTMNIYMAVADKNTVLGAYVSKQNLIEVLTAFDRGDDQLSAVPNVASTVAKLDQEAQLIGLWSPQGTLAFAAQIAASIDPRAAASIPQLGDTTPLGFSVKMGSNVIDTDAVIPVDVLTKISGLVQQIMAQRQRAPENAP